MINSLIGRTLLIRNNYKSSHLPSIGATKLLFRNAFHSSVHVHHGEYEMKDPKSVDEIVNVTIIDKNKKLIEIKGKVGDNLLYLCHRYEVPMEGACEASLACSTCHCYVQGRYFDQLPAPEEAEEDMLDMATFVRGNSRLGCQIILTKEIDGLTIELPRATRNFYVGMSAMGMFQNPIEALHMDNTAWVSAVPLVCGALSGMTTTLICHPLDLLKYWVSFIYYYQVQDYYPLRDRPRYSNVLSGLKSVVRLNGVAGLYTGLAPNLAGNIVSWGSYFYCYNMIKRGYKDMYNVSELSYIHNSTAALGAGLVTLIISNPIWLIKTIMCYNEATPYHKHTSMAEVAKETVRKYGVLGLYKGIFPGMFGLAHGSIQFVIYEELKKLANYNSSSITINNNNKRDKERNKTDYFNIIVISGSSKIVASTITYPFQVLRSRLMYSNEINTENKPSMRRLLLDVAKNEGIIGFYRGLTPNIIRVLPATCLTFFTYEFLFDKLSPKINIS